MSVIRGKLQLICLVIFGLAAASMTQASMTQASMTQAAPKDGQVVKGKGTITQSGSHTDIHQQSQFMATQWQNFNIAANESVEARQPGSNSRLLIRVDGSAPTNIAGRYSSNGITILENRAGVQFSQGAIVNVGGLLATSAQIDEKTLSGNQWRMNGKGGAVVNHGDITAGKGGAILAAVRVENTGTITAKGGDVALGAGSGFTIDFSANGLIGFEVSKAEGASLVNEGRVKAEGGVVRLTAREARALRANVVSVGGEVEATRLSRRGGVVYLSGGEEGISEVSGTIKADEKIEATSEKYVVVKTGARLTAPEILVGGDFQGKGTTATAQRTLIERNTLLDAGPAGRVIVWSDEITWFYGELRAAGGFAEISGKRSLAHVNFDGIHLGAGGTLLLDPYDITIGSTTTNDGEFSDGEILEGNGCAAATCTSTENFEISAATINALTGATLMLAAQNDISVNSAISHTNLTLTLTAGNSVNISAGINVGSGNLTLTSSAGAINFSTARAITLNGESVSLTAATAPTVSHQNLTITSGNGDIDINTNIDTGTGNLIIFAGAGDGAGSAQLNLANARSDDITLAGHHIRLESEAAPEVATAPIIISSATDLVLYTDLDAAGFKITLTAGDGDATTGSISVFGARTFTGASIFFSQDANPFPAAKLADFVVSSGLSLTYTGTQVLEIHDWMIVSDDNLTVSASGDIRVNTNIEAGTGQIALTSTAGAINFSSTEAITITGSRITLAAAAAPTASDQALTIDASAALVVNTNLNTGSANLVLEGDRLNLGSTEGSRIFLDGADITLTTSGSGTTPGERRVIVRAANNLTIGANINTGTARLSLSAGTGKLNFADTDVALSGGIITLSAPPSPSGTTDNDPIRMGGAITLTAKRNLNIQTSILTSGASGHVSLIAGDGTGENDTGAINFSNARAITLSVGTGNLTLTADAAPTVSNQPLSLVAGGNLMIGADINAGTEALTLEGGFGSNTGTIIFDGAVKPGTASREILGGAIRLDGDAGRSPAAYGGNIRIRARGALTINADINAGTGNIVLTGGRGGTGTVQFGADAVVLTGNNISLNRAGASTDSPTQSAGAITVTAAGDILVNTDIDTSGNLTLTAGDGEGTGAINFPTARAITLNGADISLTADAAPTPSNRNLTIIAAGNLSINTALNAGTAAIDLQAGRAAGTETGATGSITWNDRSRKVTAAIIRLTQDGDVFASISPAVFSTRPVAIYDGTNTQPDLSGWVDLGYTSPTTGDVVISTLTGYDRTTHIWNLGRAALVISTTGNIIIPTAGLTIIAGSITLTAAGFMGPSDAPITGAITITSFEALVINHSIATSGDLTLTAGTTLTLGGSTGSRDRMSLQGQNISLTSDTTTASTANDRITIRAADNITVGANLSAGTAGLRLYAGDALAGDNDSAGAINFTGTSVALSGVSITLSAPTAPTASATDITITATSTTADLFVLTNINTTGNLTLNSGARLRFEGGTSRRSLLGAAISLTSGTAAATAANRRVTISAAGDLTIGANLDAGTGGLRLFAGRGGTGAINVTGASVLSGASVTLEAPTAPVSAGAGAITATARTGDLTMSASLNTTGAITLTSTAGAINFTGTSVALSGASVTLDAPTAPVQSATIIEVTTTTGDLVVLTNINTTGDLTLTSGALLRFDRENDSSRRTLNGGNISLTSGSDDAMAANRRVTVSAANNLTIGANIDTGTARLGLTAGTGKLDFANTDVALSGGIITLSAPDNPSRLNGAITLTAKRNLNIQTSILTSGASGDVSLIAGDGADDTGAINFSTARAITISVGGGGLTLTADAAPTASDKNLTLSLSGNLMLGTDINTGTGDLTLEGGFDSNTGTIIFTGDAKTGSDFREIQGGNITLNGDAGQSPAAYGGNIRIRAQGNLIINADINAGTGNLVLTGGIDGTGFLRFGAGAVILTAQDVSLFTALAAFNAVAAFELSVPRGAGSLSVMATGNILLSTAIRMSGAIALTADGTINLGTARPSSLRSTSDITLTSSTAATPSPSDQDLFLASTGTTAVITIAANLNVGRGQIIFSSVAFSGGVIAFTGTPTLTAGTIEIISLFKSYFPATAPDAVFAANNFTYRFGPGGIAPSWMIGGDANLIPGGLGGKNLSIQVGSGNLVVNGSINIGSGDLTLLADGLQFGNSASTTPITLQGQNITIANSPAPSPASMRDVTIMAEENISLGVRLITSNRISAFSLNLGSNDITMMAGLSGAGKINWFRQRSADIATAVSSLTAGTITMTAPTAPDAGNVTITLTASSDLNIQTSINTTADLTLAAGGAINFDTGKAIALNGADVSLTAGAAPAVSGQALTITAAGDLTIATDINAGTAALMLEGGSGTANTGTIIFAGAVKTGTDFREILGGAITLNGDAAQSPAAYGGNIRIRARGALTINADINAGSGNIVLTGGRGRGGTGTVQFGAGAVVLTGNDINLNRGGSSTGSPTQSAGAITVTAAGDIVVNTDIDTSGNLTLTAGDGAGTGAITFTGTPALTGAAIALTQAAAFDDLVAPPTLAPSSSLSFDNTATASQTVHAWMIEGISGKSLSISSAGGLVVNSNINTGTGDLTLTASSDLNIQTSINTSGDLTLAATGKLNFNGTGGGITLNAANISLTSGTDAATAGNRPVNIFAANDITMAANINTGTGRLRLVAGTGKLNFSGESVTLFGANVRLAAPDAPVQSATVVSATATGTLEIRTSIDTTGDITLIAGNGSTTGAINFATARAVTLSGAAITLTADTAPTPSNQDLTIIAAGNLAINTDLNAGSGVLGLQAGRAAGTETGATGSITWNDRLRKVTAALITLTQDGDAFASASPAVFSKRPDAIYDGTNIQPDLSSWADSGYTSPTSGDVVISTLTAFGYDAATGVWDVGLGDLVISTTGNIIIPTAGLTIIAGSITLTAAGMTGPGGAAITRAITITSAGALTINHSIQTARNINLTAGTVLTLGGSTGSRDRMSLLGRNISLTSSTAAAGTADDRITIRAANNITVGANISAGTAGLRLYAGDALAGDNDSAGAINFTGTSVALSGASITLSAPTAPTASATAITITATSTNADLFVLTNINTTGNLTLDSAARLRFDRENDISRRSLLGAAISLTSGTAAATGANRRLTISAAGDLTIAANLNGGTGGLRLSAGTGAINFTGDSVALSGANVRLSAPTAPVQSATVVSATATGTLDIRSGINTSGDLTLTAGGVIVFTTARDIRLNGNNITLTATSAALPRASNKNLTVTAASALVINASLNTGTENPLLTAGTTLTFGTEGSGDIILSGRGIQLTSSADTALPGGRNVILRTTNDIAIGANIDAGTNDLEFAAGTDGSGLIRFNMISSVTLKGRNVTLDAPATSISENDITLMVTASSNINIAARINTGTADLTLNAGGAINFSTTRATTLNGNNITLTAAAAPVASNQNLTLTAAEALMINTHLNTGTSVADDTANLTLSAGTTIQFGVVARMSLQGQNISLTSGSEAAIAANRRITIRAADNITVAANISAGTAGLRLYAGDALAGDDDSAGAINFTGGSALSGVSITLSAPTAPTASAAAITATTTTGDLFVLTNINTTGNLTLNSGALLRFDSKDGDTSRRSLLGAAISLTSGSDDAIAANRRVTIRAKGNLTIGANLNGGTGGLRLFAGNSGTDGSGQIRYTGTSVTLGGASITLEDPDTSKMATNIDVTLTALNDINIGSIINSGTSDLTLTAGGAINFITRAVTLRSANITLTAAVAPTPSRHNLTLTAASALVVNTNLNTGTGDLTLEAGTTIQFGAAAARMSLLGQNISLTSGTAAAIAADRRITINAAENLTVAANLDAGTSGLRLLAGTGTAGTGGINVTGASVLSGASITLSAAGAGSGTGALTATATGNLNINADINTSGTLTLTAGEGTGTGAINFSTAKPITLTASLLNFASDAPARASHQDLTIDGGLAMTGSGGINIGDGIFDFQNATFSATKITASRFDVGVACGTTVCIHYE